MAGELSDTGAYASLQVVAGNWTYNTAATAGRWLALFTAAPADAAGGVPGTGGWSAAAEVAVANYARQSVTFGVPVLNNGVYEIRNSAQVVFSFGGSVTVTHGALVTASTGTSCDLLGWWSMSTARTFTAGSQGTWATNAVTLSLD